MTNREIGKRLGEAIRGERERTNEVLKLINLAFDSRAYLDHGFSSMFDWLVRGYGYGNGSAQRRIEAARLLRAVPEISAKLESGSLNLSTVSRAQTLINAQEKSDNKRMQNSVKAQLIEKIESKTEREVEQKLLELLPAAAETVHQTRRTQVNESTLRLSLTITNEMDNDLRRAQEVLSHIMPGAGDAEVLAYALKFLLKAKERRQIKIRHSTSGAEVGHAATAGKSAIPSGFNGTTLINPAGSRIDDTQVDQSASPSCSFQDHVTGQVCGSRYQLQRDHIVPRALGGTNDPENLRWLCRAHNVHAAERIFGIKFMSQFRRV